MRIVEAGFQFEHPIDGTEILRRIERAGRTCYKSEAKITEDSANAFVLKIIKSGHESVLSSLFRLRRGGGKGAARFSPQF